MSSSTETVWYRNTEHDTLHEVEKGSATEKRLKREQREVFEDGDDEPTFEPAYEKLTSAEVKKAQEAPEKVPGYPAGREAARKDREAEKARQAKRDEALDATILANAQPPADPGQK